MNKYTQRGEKNGVVSPIGKVIIMSENMDKTCTRFVIPTNSKILYMHEIIVKGYEDECEER